MYKAIIYTLIILFIGCNNYKTDFSLYFKKLQKNKFEKVYSNIEFGEIRKDVFQIYLTIDTCVTYELIDDSLIINDVFVNLKEDENLAKSEYLTYRTQNIHNELKRLGIFMLVSDEAKLTLYFDYYQFDKNTLPTYDNEVFAENDKIMCGLTYIYTNDLSNNKLHNFFELIKPTKLNNSWYYFEEKLYEPH